MFGLEEKSLLRLLYPAMLKKGMLCANDRLLQAQGGMTETTQYVNVYIRVYMNIDIVLRMLCDKR